MTAFAGSGTGAVSGTLSGGTDTINLITGRFVEITNLSTSATLYVATDSTITPAMGTNGTTVIRAGESTIVENPAHGTDATAQARVINIKGTAAETFAARVLNGWPR